MRYMVGKLGLPQMVTVLRNIPDCGMVLHPRAWQNPTGPYSCDNGVYAQFCKGGMWDQEMHEAWIGMLAKIPAGNPPLWVLLPDAVGDWPRTVELAQLYGPLIRERGWPLAIALQDGCNFEEVLGFDPDWVFVGGTTEWKEKRVSDVVEFFQPRGIRVHVGRVNTRRRLRLCQSAGVDSVDGTTLNKFRDATLPLIADTLLQPCLEIR